MSARNKKRHRARVPRGDAKALLKFFLLFAFLMLLFGGILRLVTSWQNRIWVGNSRVTFVTAKNPITVFSFEQSRELVSISFPKNVEIDGANGTGDWKLENLYELGNSRGDSGNLLIKSLQYSLVVPIDGYISGNFGPGFPGVLAVFYQESNFTFFDKIKIAYVLGRVAPREHKNLSAEKLGIITKKRLGDGTLGFKLVPEKVRDVTARELQDTSVALEKTGLPAVAGIGIVNASTVSRAGEQIAQIIRAMGSQILWVKNGEKEQLRCIVKAENKTETVARVAKIFSCEIRLEKNLPAQIVFVIGPELAGELP